MRMPSALGALVMAVTVCVAGCHSESADFPAKSITIVVPWSAGGGTDSLARAIAQEATDVFGVAVNVLNQTGGQGTIGHLYGMQAFPDGYTVTMITFELATYKALGRAHVEVAGFTPLMQLNEDPSAITVRADAPYQTLKDFIDAARAAPEQITIGNSGPGGVWDLAARQLETVADVKFTHIPFDGAAPAVVQLLGGHLDAVSVSPAEVMQHVEVGRLRSLGVMAAERDAALPDVPTMREEGVDVQFGAWRGLAAPAGTPPEIVATLRQGFKEAFDRPAFKQAAANLKLGLSYLNGDDFTRALIQREQSADALVRAAINRDASLWHYLSRRGLFPTAASGGLIVLLVVLAVTSRRDARTTATGSTAPFPNASLGPRIVWALAGLVVYWAAMYWLGYIGPTIAFLVFLQWVVMADRRIVRILSCSLIVTAAVYLAFGQALDVPLPSMQ